MKHGEIRWYKFKHPDKKRPVLILTRTSVIEYLGEVTIAPITITIRNIPTEVLLTTEDVLTKDCAINFDHLQTVPKGNIGSLIVSLNHNKLDEIRDAVLFAFELGLA